MKKLFSVFLLTFTTHLLYPQSNYWQQRISYTIEIDMNAENHQFAGSEKIIYTNNSPDTLYHLFMHLYFNAFQPGSMMDVRSRTISDPDSRVKDRIFKLNDDEIGYHKIKSVKQRGSKLNYQVIGTILKIELDKPIHPGSDSKFVIEFESQVPLQIRRSGRDNKEGIEFSMAQWYPKVAEYDHEGWHTHPYIGREFHSIWGDFEVKIQMDEKYVIGGTGILQNPEDVGHGYESKDEVKKKVKNGKLTWHFIAENVIDFAWAADPDYKHVITSGPNDMQIHYFYQENDKTKETWKKLVEIGVKTFEMMNEFVGQYPYKQYSVIQGGDGGMEYPMCTFINGEGSYEGLVSVTVHEIIHSWFQMMLAFNESYYAWMDEGFTSYYDAIIGDSLLGRNSANPLLYANRSYRSLVLRGIEEPLKTHSDHFSTNRAYGVASYVKGLIFLNQLGYIVGEKQRDQIMKSFFNQWKFKHPKPNDLIRIAEKSTGIELNWLLDFWINSTKTIDYGITAVMDKGNITTVQLEKIGKVPMPLDVVVTFNDSSKTNYNIPLKIMLGSKNNENDFEMKTLEAWPWVYPYYSFDINHPIEDIQSIIIDPSYRMADINRDNNAYPFNNDVTLEATDAD